MPLNNTSAARNRATSPGALASLAQLNPPAGIYTVEATVYFSGTAPVDGVDTDNVVLTTDNVFTAAVIPSPAVLGVVFTKVWESVQTNGQNIKLNTGGASTVGTIYNTTIKINRTGSG